MKILITLPSHTRLRCADWGSCDEVCWQACGYHWKNMLQSRMKSAREVFKMRNDSVSGYGAEEERGDTRSGMVRVRRQAQRRSESVGPNDW